MNSSNPVERYIRGQIEHLQQPACDCRASICSMTCDAPSEEWGPAYFWQVGRLELCHMVGKYRISDAGRRVWETYNTKGFKAALALIESLDEGLKR